MQKSSGVQTGERCSPAENGSGDPYRLPSLHHVLDVLEFLSSEGPEVQLGEIATAVGIGKPGVHRILRNLESRGYVRRTGERHTYSIGVRLWELGVSGGELQFLRDAVLPYLADVTRVTGETSHMVVYDRGEALYIERVETDHAIKAYGRVGVRAPAYCVATGKVLLASQPEEEVSRVVSAGLRAFTPSTITDAEQLLAELSRVREQGYALNLEEWRAEVVGVGVPAGNVGTRMSTAIGLSGPSYRFRPDAAKDTVPTLLDVTKGLRTDGIVNPPDKTSPLPRYRGHSGHTVGRSDGDALEVSRC